MLLLHMPAQVSEADMPQPDAPMDTELGVGVQFEDDSSDDDAEEENVRRQPCLDLCLCFAL